MADSLKIGGITYYIKLGLSCTLCMRIHPPMRPPLLHLGHVCTMSTRDECVGVGGCRASSGSLVRWGSGVGFIAQLILAIPPTTR
jgi:hypothetical protein